MTSQAWLESSLHRSSKLGREVLERARRRSVRWTNTSPYDSRSSAESTVSGEKRQLEDHKGPGDLQKSLDNAFGRIVEFMDHASHECKDFYKSVPEPNDHEKQHICYFHSGRPSRAGPSIPLSTSSSRHIPVPMPVKDSVKGQCGPEDFHIVLSPGSYAISASIQGSSPQTQVVRVNPGESMSLTFDI